MKLFTNNDVIPDGAIPGAGKIYANYPDDFVDSPLNCQKRGLQQTSGYGAKLTTTKLISFNGILYRVYRTCYGNSGSSWFKTCGRKIFVD